jgi:hypothetical protein
VLVLPSFDEYSSGRGDPKVSCLFLNYYCHAVAVLDLTVQDPSIPDRLTFSLLHAETISGLAGRRRCQVRQPVLDTTHRAWAGALASAMRGDGRI